MAGIVRTASLRGKHCNQLVISNVRLLRKLRHKKRKNV